MTSFAVLIHDADEHKGEEGKFDKYFTPEPGEGD